MKSIPRLIVYTGLMALPIHAAILPALDPATALYDSDVKGIVSDGDKGPGVTGHLSGIPAINTPEHAAGFTFNIDITPAAADLTGTVLLISLGGTSNGSGLFLVNGVPTVMTKQGSADGSKPISLADTALNEVAVQSTLGALTAGARHSFSASWNHAGVLEVKAKPESGSATTDAFAITGTPGNWSGADTLHVGTIVSKGYIGGMSGSATGSFLGAPFDVDLATSFTGTIHRALFWNSSAITPMPPEVNGFEVAKLNDAGDIRVHWKAGGGSSADPLTVTINDGTSDVHTTGTASGYVVIPASSATHFTLTASNHQGSVSMEADVPEENAFTAAVRADAPVAWFRFEEKENAPWVIDSANNAAPHAGNFHNQIYTGQQGSISGAAAFGGGGIISDFILDPAAATHGFTIEAVVLRAPGGDGPITSQTDMASQGRGHLSVNPDGTIVSFLAGGAAQLKKADGKLDTDTWAHLVMVVDPAIPEIRWYLDGQQVGTTTDGLNPDGTTFDPNFILEATTGRWHLGMFKDLTNPWEGLMDEVAIYASKLDDPDSNGDRADSRITAHRNAWWSETSGLIGFSALTATITEGQSTQLVVNVGPDITSVTIDNGVGTVVPVNGRAVITVKPGVTTFYEVTAQGPGGPFTRSLTVTVNAAPAVAPRIASTHLTGGNLVVDFTGQPSTTYQVRGSTDLTSFTIDHGTAATDAAGAGVATVPVTGTKGFVRIEE